MEKRLPTRAGSRKRVDIQKGYRYVTPAVRLERKQISMLNPPPGPSQPPAPDSHTVSTSDVGARTTIVGKKGPLEEEGSSLVLRAPTNGQSPEHATEEPKSTPSGTQSPPPPAQERTEQGNYQKEGEGAKQETDQETRTQELSQETKEETQVTRQEQTKETQALSPRTSTEVRTTPTTEQEPSTTTTKDDGSRSPATTKTTSAASRPNVQFADQPVRLETADLMEFFEEQAPVGKDGGIQIAEQSVRPETAIVMEFFEEQPVRQEGVQVPRQMARQETAEVIEFFEEQDHSMEDVSRPNLLAVPSPQHGSLTRGQRSPSPGSLHPSVGLNHLDNLIRLMEQLSNLKDENAKLRKKCDYLETTKNLLKARSELMSASDSSSASGYQSLPSSRHQGHHQHRHHHRNGSGTRDAEGARPRLFSAEDVQCLEISESASDSRPKRPKAPMHKRSFSTGSLEVEILDETSTTEGRITKSKSGKSVIGAKSPKQKSKGSKWSRVKKVLTGQFWYEDIGTTLKSLKELGRSAQRYSSVSTEGQDFGPAAQQRSLDTSLDTELMGSRPPGVSSTSAEASSAGRSPNIPGPGHGGGVEELGTEIWMGPPGWWEQYEASKRQSEASNASDVSSVIEVKTMYLGSKQKDTERLLKVKPLTRRQSSPSLTTKSAEEEEEEEEGVDGVHPVHRSSSYKDEELDLPKDLSGSVPAASTSSSSKPDSKKLHRKAWGRVKDIIHVRKDSVKKRARRAEREKESSDWSQGEEVSEVDLEGLMEEQLSGDFGDGIISRSTPKTSPMVVPRQPSSTSKSFSESPPQGTDPSLLSSSKGAAASTSGGTEMAALLASSMSEEFAQKLQAWQELQLRKSSSFKVVSGGGSGEAEGESRAGVADGTGGVEATQELGALLPSSSSPPTTTTAASAATTAATPGEAAEKVRAKGAPPSQPAAESSAESAAAPAEPSPTELQAPSVNVEELQRRISESFSRKLAEWERRKYRRPTTPEMEHKGARSRKEKEKEKEERSRSKKSREEKERERQEKAREREMQRVEKEQVKLEKEKVRIEKERLRALEKQAKLERMKGRLSQADTEAASAQPTASGSPPSGAGLAPTAAAQNSAGQYKVTADFKKKLDDWEQMKSSLTLPDPGTSSPEGATPSPQPSSSPPTFPLASGAGGREPEAGKGKGEGKPPPLSLQPYNLDTPEERSPVDKASDVSYGDDSTSVTEENYTRSNIASLERANSELLREVSRKEEEYNQLQEEVQKLNSKLDKVRQEHAAEMARFRRELETGTVSGPVQLEVGELESTVRELEEKIALMENAGDQLAESMETAAIGKWQSVEGEEVVSQQLVDMVEQMKSMLVQASRSRESPPHPSSAAPPPPSPPPPPPLQLQPLPPLHELLATGDFSQKTLALQNFEKVYSHAMKLQVQMNNLRVSQLERNKEIMLIKRQLLLQEVNNVLLQAHITRRETELYQYREARRQGIAVRRWNTFSGQGDNEARPPLLRNISLQDSDDPLRPSSSSPPPPPATSSSAAAAKPSSKHDDIPCITDEDASIPTAGIAEGAKAEKDVPSHSPSSPSTTTAPTPEKSTDHQECHLASQVAATTTTTTSSAPVSQAAAPSSQQQPPTPSTRTLERGETRVTAPAAASAGTTAEETPLSAQPMASSLPLSSTSSKEKGTETTPSSAATSGTTTTIPASSVSRVETGPPTLLTQTPATSLSASSSAAAEELKKPPRTEAPAEPIPERPDEGVESISPPAQSASPEDDKYSQTVSVMECTKSVLDAEASSLQGEPSSKAPLPRSVEATAGSVDITSKGQTPKAIRSPVLRQRYLRRQKEEREKRKDTPSSPKSSHSGESGKPPLPRQSTPHQSPSTSHRSKSVGDMDGIEPDKTQGVAPLQEVIQKFEKRATVCETEERKIEFRKTPSPTLHLPRVGLVSRVRRLKPAAELLQESQRYRSGHSIYATRIMQRYLPGKSPQSGAATSPTRSQDKENISDTSYVQAIVRRLSRETTPVKSTGSSSASSSLSLHRTDSPGRAHPDLVSSLAQKLSSSCGPTDTSQKISPSLPLKDLTNEGQAKQLTQAFCVEEGQGPTITDQTLSPLNLAASDRTRAAEEVTLQPVSVTEGAATPFDAKPDSTISPASHKSMPALASDQPQVAENGARERAATYCVSEGERPRPQQQQQLHGPDNGSESIEHIAEEFLDPALLSIREKKGQKISPSSSTNSKNALCCRSSTCTKAKSSPSSSSSSPQTAKVPKIPSSPKTQERRAGREKMETIGVLCKQSMSFDLGVSLRAQSPEVLPQRPQSAESLRTAPEMEAGGREGAKARPSSTSSEGEATASSEEKKKSRARFLDSSWLQKPKKFFKVSK